MLRVGIAGCGLIAGAPLREGRPIATNHAAACHATDGCELVAAADPDADRRGLFARHWNLRDTYTTVDDMLVRAKLDLLVVATPPETHEAVCTAAIDAGVSGLLCEKPLTGHAASARRVVDLCKAAGVPLVVNFTRRWDASHVELERRIRAGDLGTLRSVTGVYTGTLRGNGSHLVDTARMLTGRSAWSCRWTTPLAPECADGPIAATLEAEDCVFHFSPVVGAEYFVFEIHLVGTRGRARLLLGGNDIRLDFPAPSERYPGYAYLLREESLPKDTLPNAFVRAHAALGAAVRREAALPVDAAEHVTTLDLVEDLVARATATKKAAP